MRERGAAGRRLLGRLSGIADGMAQLAEGGAAPDAAAAVSATVRRCPYCTEYIDLRRCDVVSAVGSTSAGNAEGRGFDNLGQTAPDGEQAPGRPRRVREYQVLHNAHAAQQRAGSTSVLNELFMSVQAGDQLRPLSQVASPQQMPRRQCARCGQLLPTELDELDTRILAVVGVTGAGKTHYLAQALTEATRRGTLERFGCTEFAPTDYDKTAHILHNDYYTPVIRQRELLRATNPREAPRQFTFTATVSNQRFLLVTHDIAGESLTDPYQRARSLVFLRRADAMIFLLDPVEFDSVRSRLPSQLAGGNKPADQMHLLRQCLKELDQSSPTEVPVRIVVSKADLIGTYCGLAGPWQNAPADSWRADIGIISESVMSMLSQLQETEALRAVAGRTRTLFHAVSSLGTAPQDGRLTDGKPMRCADPLGAALLGMAGRPTAVR